MARTKFSKPLDNSIPTYCRHANYVMPPLTDNKINPKNIFEGYTRPDDDKKKKNKNKKSVMYNKKQTYKRKKK